MDNQEAYELYKLSKTSIQMHEVHLETINMTNELKNINGDFVNEITFGKRIEILDSHLANCFLRTVIQCKNEATDCVELMIEVIYKGNFKAVDAINVDQFETWLDLQIVPQLLPYTRTLITNVTALLSIPPINLPTMDILDSIKVNHNNEGVDGE